MKVRKKLLVLTAIRGQCDKEDPQTRRKINLTQLSVEMSISPLPRPKEKGLENCKFNRSILDYEEGWQNIHISYMIQWYNLEEKSKKKKYIFPSPSSFSQRVFWQNLKKNNIIRTYLGEISDAQSWKCIFLYCKQKCWKWSYDQLP